MRKLLSFLLIFTCLFSFSQKRLKFEITNFSKKTKIKEISPQKSLDIFFYQKNFKIFEFLPENFFDKNYISAEKKFNKDGIYYRFGYDEDSKLVAFFFSNNPDFIPSQNKYFVIYGNKGKIQKIYNFEKSLNKIGSSIDWEEKPSSEYLFYYDELNNINMIELFWHDKKIAHIKKV